MPKFTLIAEHTDIYGNLMGHKVTHEFNVDTLDSILENTDLFLRGVGFMPSGILDYVEEENFSEGYNNKYNPDQEDNIQHSGFFYDTGRNK